jgi:NTP pyrophosphatase (non-canonical NTP hydrolase)
MLQYEVLAYTSAVDMLVDFCHGAAFEAGWWGSTRMEVRDRTRFGKALVAEKLALIHSEVSEALEGVRKDKMDDHLPSRKSVEVELADALIRICDLAGAMQLDLGGALVEKMAYNAERQDHKPEARAAAGGKAF